MATTTLNLPIESDLAKRINKYARKRKTSVSSITENFFAIVTSSENSDEQAISPLVKSFSLEGVNVSPDFDYKQALNDAKNEKYL
ncbi:MAG: DUF6364 family protein [Dysgonamonadaceae bacterium]|jgi:uncharacterized protein YajQ (UPF0234 family)|nr:DUF6364 family protein [Dysgonamonadaceae bacterium]